MDGPVFAQIAGLRERRERLTELAATPAELDPITKAELEELRHLARPPELVRECLELVYIILHAPKFRRSVQRPLPSGRVDLPWESVRTMLARFESFFPSMRSYDIAPLIGAPEVVDRIQRGYLDGVRLTEDRVRRSNRAAAGLFRWCGSAVARVQAALELAAVSAELEELEREHPAEPESELEQEQPQEQKEEQQPPPEPKWMCKAIRGWVEYPEDVAQRLSTAADVGGRVSFSLNFERYEVDLATRTQRNLSTGMKRPVRLVGGVLDVASLQGAWQTSWGPVILVDGPTVRLVGRPADEPLEDRGAGVVFWSYGGGWTTKEGSTPMHVKWTNSDSELGSIEVTWTAVANPSSTTG